MFSTKALSANQRRTETRRERTQKKLSHSKVFENVEIATINFATEENVAFVIRSAACFGCGTVNVIGSIPPHKELVRRSGTCQDYVKINQFSNTHQFLEYSRKNNVELISAEIDDDATNIHDFEFPVDKRFCIVLGHEISGIPNDIYLNSKHVYIPMPGKAFNLNTSQAGNIFLYEIAKRYAKL